MILRIISNIGILLCWAMVVSGWASTPSGTLYPGLPDPVLEARTADRSEDDKDAALDEKFQALFEQGYERFSKGRFQQAGQILLRFLSERTPDDTDYEWAEFFFRDQLV